MGSAQCCKKIEQEDLKEELLIIDDTIKQTVKQQDSSPEKVKNCQKKTEECGTPAFPELRSQQSKRSEQFQSLKEIQFVGQVEKEDHNFKSSCTLGKKRQNDSPIVAFEIKNSLRSFDSNKLKKLQTVTEIQLNLKNITSPRDEDSLNHDNQTIKLPDEKSNKSILKQEMKYSKFRSSQVKTDSLLRKVQFHVE